MSAIHGGVKVNWGRLLFNIFKDLVTPASKQARVFVVQNKNITVDVDEPAEPVVKNAAPKRIPAPAVGELVAKKKRTTVERDAPAKKDLMMVPVVEDPEPISIIPPATSKAQRRRTPKRKLVLKKGSDDEIFDSIIHQVIVDTTTIELMEPALRETDLEESVIKEKAEIAEEGTDVREPDVVEPVVVETSETTVVETESRIDVPAITNYDEDSSLKVLSNEEGPLVETEREEEKEKEIELVTAEGMSLAKITDSEETEHLSKVLELTEQYKSDEESMSIADLMAQIPGDMMLPSHVACLSALIALRTEA
ncbi:F-box/kelch-repeat protein-like [Dorcoceras hygrometricum]|uniref:F-box/kelch-repeat protein-like n=1 Tax=Dorcoceras hygrometricum TaxID=472368 RepID=A0A2Z7D766_9LAMI|nr:F-box/kelch-repeat protein-like [Dorcoceras hygrometricum]